MRRTIVNEITTQSMHPKYHANASPDKVAIHMLGSGEAITYRELEQKSNQGANFLRALGLKPGDRMAICLRNCKQFFYIYWAAQRSGYYLTPVSTHLNIREVAYIVNDCSASVLIVSEGVSCDAAEIKSFCPNLKHIFSVGESKIFDSWDELTSTSSINSIRDEVGGHTMFYSSGTTGHPKGIEITFAGNSIEKPPATMLAFSQKLHYDDKTVYLVPAPLYHAAPLGFSAHIHRLGGVVVVMEKFDELDFLRAIEKYQVTHTQVVPTMFIRLLRLPDSVKNSFDCSTLRSVLHSAAPCPIEVKEKMIDWFGPCIDEQYSGSEGVGCTLIKSDEWLERKGSVGRAIFGEIGIFSNDGQRLGDSHVGGIYFKSERIIRYRNDPEKTAQSKLPGGWFTLGDVGYMKDGYLFLSDRVSDMIISGGVNIYPKESEDVLILHPKVADVAVFGIPHPEFGEEVKAAVQLLNGYEASPELVAELLEYCRSHLSPQKCPRTIDFEAQLPRMENGKLYKRLLKEKYMRTGADPAMMVG